MKYTVLVVVLAAIMSACNTEKGAKDASLETFEDSVSFAIGTDVALDIKGGIEAQNMDSLVDIDLIVAGFRDALLADSAKLSAENAKGIISRFLDKQREEKANNNKGAGEAFLAENGAKPGVVTTASGLQYIVLKEGEGQSPTLADQVRVHYTGKLLNGKVFDSSIERNEPVDFYLRSVIPGWTEALQLMKPGAEYKIFIPGHLAYGEQGNPRGGIGPNEVLIFDVRLLEVIK